MTDQALSPLEGCPFAIMDGAGNDFVIVDLRQRGEMTPDAARYLGDREGPYGCDQIIGIAEGPKMLIWNADGSVSGACGNAARCIADLLMDELGEAKVAFESPAGWLHGSRRGELIAIDMGEPRWAWNDIPIASETRDTKTLPLPTELLHRHHVTAPVGVSMGNPHAVFFVDDAERFALEPLGEEVETHPLFPERVNVTVASKADAGFRIRTWERGVGVTKACGTAACATLVAAVRLGQDIRSGLIQADGGTLMIRWDETTNHVEMAGPTKRHDRGVF